MSEDYCSPRAKGERNALLKTETKNLLNRLIKLRGKMQTIPGAEVDDELGQPTLKREFVSKGTHFKKSGSNGDLTTLRSPQHCHANSICSISKPVSGRQRGRKRSERVSPTFKENTIGGVGASSTSGFFLKKSSSKNHLYVKKELENVDVEASQQYTFVEKERGT